MSEKKEWFASWFDTEWYHILYKNRSSAEAEGFISKLMEFLALEKGSRLLDAACGAGRHSIQLNKLGFNVNGFDLSEQSISKAKLLESESVRFTVADLREFCDSEEYDGIFNFFTSFGYFETIKDNLKVLTNFKKMLKPDGCLVIDFMNAHKVIEGMVKKESKTIDDITFHITREVVDNRIVKTIRFKDKEEYVFSEKVSAFELSNFEEMLHEVGFKIDHTFGNYQLNPFVLSESPRLIIIASSK